MEAAHGVLWNEPSAWEAAARGQQQPSSSETAVDGEEHNAADTAATAQVWDDGAAAAGEDGLDAETRARLFDQLELCDGAASADALMQTFGECDRAERAAMWHEHGVERAQYVAPGMRAAVLAEHGLSEHEWRRESERERARRAFIEAMRRRGGSAAHQQQHALAPWEHPLVLQHVALLSGSTRRAARAVLEAQRACGDQYVFGSVHVREATAHVHAGDDLVVLCIVDVAHRAARYQRRVQHVWPLLAESSQLPRAQRAAVLWCFATLLPRAYAPRGAAHAICERVAALEAFLQPNAVCTLGDQAAHTLSNPYATGEQTRPAAAAPASVYATVLQRCRQVSVLPFPGGDDEALKTTLARNAFAQACRKHIIDRITVQHAARTNDATHVLMLHAQGTNAAHKAPAPPPPKKQKPAPHETTGNSLDALMVTARANKHVWRKPKKL